MYTSIQEFSMEHFLLENPQCRTMESTEFMEAYDKWVKELQEEAQADIHISLAKSGFYGD